MPSIFSKILSGEIPSYKIAEDQDHYAFLDIRPLQKGHTLVIPKMEIDYIFDLDDKVLSSLMVFSKRVAKAVEASISCKRVGVAVIGLEVPHVHIHLVPLQTVGDINFTKPPVLVDSDEMESIAHKIQSNFQ
jgi:histidine triad (HIT) family protein